MDREGILKDACESIVNLEGAVAVEVAQKALREGLDPVELIEKGYTEGMKRVGEMFEKEEIFIPHVMAAADALTAAINILEPEIKRRGGTVEAKGKIVMGTIEGDIHDIGKNIVCTMFRVYGYDVHDLGRDIPVNT